MYRLLENRKELDIIEETANRATFRAKIAPKKRNQVNHAMNAKTESYACTFASRAQSGGWNGGHFKEEKETIY